MRISDWSSDVCSSDLLNIRLTSKKFIDDPLQENAPRAIRDRMRFVDDDDIGGEAGMPIQHHLQTLLSHHEDRALGKRSVSVNRDRRNFDAAGRHTFARNQPSEAR